MGLLREVGLSGSWSKCPPPLLSSVLHPHCLSLWIHTAVSHLCPCTCWSLCLECCAPSSLLGGVLFILWVSAQMLYMQDSCPFIFLCYVPLLCVSKLSSISPLLELNMLPGSFPVLDCRFPEGRGYSVWCPCCLASSSGLINIDEWVNEWIYECMRRRQ